MLTHALEEEAELRRERLLRQHVDELLEETAAVDADLDISVMVDELDLHEAFQPVVELGKRRETVFDDVATSDADAFASASHERDAARQAVEEGALVLHHAVEERDAIRERQQRRYVLEQRGQALADRHRTQRVHQRLTHTRRCCRVSEW